MSIRKAFLVTALFCALNVPFAEADEKVCGVYTSIGQFASREAREAAIKFQPSFLMEKHKPGLAADNQINFDTFTKAKFNTNFMTIYPLWGKDWWDIPAAKELVASAVAASRRLGRVHLGLSLFNDHMCRNVSRYPGASRTIQCDGTRPDWVCFFDDKLWDYYIKNVVEFAKLRPDGIFLDPEAYGSECYLCFCDNCVKKFNAFANEQMPTGLVKPDGWIRAKGLWKNYTVLFHDHEVRRHASAMREAIHAIDPKIQLSSLLWDYPVAVGIGDPRESYFRNLAIGLGTREMPAWTLPEHTYYSDADDLKRIIDQIKSDAQGEHVKVLPGIRLLRRNADSLIDRGQVIRDADIPGYWMYELSDVMGKTPIDFEGALIDPAEKYIQKLGEMNELILGKPSK